MQKQDYNLNNTNQIIAEKIKGKNLDYCHVLVQSFEKNLSVVGEYKPLFSFIDGNNEYVKLVDGDKAQTVEDGGDFFYGVSPAFDSKIAIENVSSLAIKTEADLNKLFEDKKTTDCFMLHVGQEKYLPALSRLIALAVFSHFGICIKMSKQQYDDLCSYFLNEKAIYNEAQLNTLCHFDHKKGCLVLTGCPTQELLDYLNNTKPIVLCKEKDKHEEYADIYEAFKRGVTIVKGRVFYSGALLKPTLIKSLDSNNQNDNICSICICFERSSYSAVCAFDNPTLVNHPLLSENYRNALIEMFEYDDSQKAKLIENLNNAQTQEEKMKCVSDYVSSCLNVNQIGVSANIVTKDGYLLFGKRNNNSIDEGTLYPGVNGNAEVSDSRVSFYRNSVYEDYPTISINDSRIDFFGEIQRETYGELRQVPSIQEWTCYGVCISGNTPPKESHIDKPRRLHFNLIFENYCDKNLIDIQKESQKATEAFETIDYLGLYVLCYKNKFTLFIKGLYRIIMNVVNHKDFVEAVLAIAFAVSFIGKSCSIRELIPLILAALIIFVELCRLVAWCIRIVKTLRSTKPVYVYSKTKVDDFGKKDKVVFKEKRKKGNNKEDGKPVCDYHPVAFAALILYICNKSYDTFFNIDRREEYEKQS